VLLIFVPFGIYYAGIYPTVAVLSGGVWGMVNLMLLTRLVRAAIRPGGANKMEVAGVALVKFPLLYASGYFLATTPLFGPLALLAGFSVPLAVMVLKVAARALLGADRSAGKRGQLQRAV